MADPVRRDLRDFLPASVLRQLAERGYGVVKIEGYQPDTAPALQGDDMSQADNAVLSGLEERIEALTARVAALEERAAGKELHGELYGAEPDHAADRAERSAMAPRVPRR